MKIETASRRLTTKIADLAGLMMHAVHDSNLYCCAALGILRLKYAFRTSQSLEDSAAADNVLWCNVTWRELWLWGIHDWCIKSRTPCSRTIVPKDPRHKGVIRKSLLWLLWYLSWRLYLRYTTFMLHDLCPRSIIKFTFGWRWRLQHCVPSLLLVFADSVSSEGVSASALFPAKSYARWQQHDEYGQVWIIESMCSLGDTRASGWWRPPYSRQSHLFIADLRSPITFTRPEPWSHSLRLLPLVLHSLLSCCDWPCLQYSQCRLATVLLLFDNSESANGSFLFRSKISISLEHRTWSWYQCRCGDKWRLVAAEYFSAVFIRSSILSGRQACVQCSKYPDHFKGNRSSPIGGTRRHSTSVSPVLWRTW